MTSIIKHFYNLYKKLQTGCNSTDVLNSVEKQKDEIIVTVTSDVQDVTIAERTRANTMYEETKTSINENIEKIVTEDVEVIVAIQTELTEPIAESIPEPIVEDQQSECSSIHSPPPSPESFYDENQTEIIGVVVDTDDSSIIKPSYNKFI